MKDMKEYYLYIRTNVLISDVCKKLNIALMPSGEDYICKCIFHSDEHPSMRLYTQSNRYHCFQCGENGDVFSFVKETLKCDFKECLNWLEQQFPEILSQKPRFSKTYERTGYDIAQKYYSNMTDDEKNKLSLFARNRDFELDFLIENQIYYAEGGKLKKIFEDDIFIEEKQKLEDIKLFKNIPSRMHDIRMGKFEDFFKKDRIIITLRDNQKKVVGFAGRSIYDGDKPKYLFTKNLNKQEWLYGFYHVSQKKYTLQKDQTEELYLVEGIFDALRLQKMNRSAVAVLGSHLLKGQSQIVAEYVKQSEHNVSICIFMDSDEAGLEGNYKTIKNLWTHSILRHTDIYVKVITGKEKDPDEYYRENNENGSGIITYNVIEYLFRYFLRSVGISLTELDVIKEYKERTIEEKIGILHSIENLLIKEEWQELFQRYSNDFSKYIEKTQDSIAANYGWNLIQNYVHETGDVQEYLEEKDKDYLYRMQSALEVAHASYKKESILLDEDTWERIAVCADIFYPYFYELLQENKSLQIPMLTLQEPKKKEEQRKKSLYIHEELILQQYVLNELLSYGTNGQYESFIPAVRYQEGQGTYLTGYGYQNIIDEVVSYAYQIQMSAVNGISEMKGGMYRPFYDCWKDYIQYVQEGIQKLQGDVVYRVKLDIKGFYDHIKKYVVRNVIYKPIENALLKDESKFACFKEENNDLRAKKLVEWILNELYIEEYYDAEDGQLRQKSDSNCGIPQGPNLSSYIANVILFEVDKEVYQIVKGLNNTCKEDDKIVARYCRYVDDMIIIASNPSDLLQIKNIIISVLYNLGLELSQKTEAEDGVSKQEALDWTIDAKGGLGVSAAFDMADDTIESVFDECSEYDMMDRGDALKVLQSALKPMLYEGIDINIDTEQFIEIIFKMPEIRINDIFRFSEILLYKSAQTEEDFFDQYQLLWNKGMKCCPLESMLWTEGIDIYVFLEGCIRILRRQKEIENIEIYTLWKPVQSKIEQAFKDGVVTKNVLNVIHDKELLRKNAWIIQLKLLQISSFIDHYINLAWSDAKNEYLERWMWSAIKYKGKERISGENDISNPKIIQKFHSIIIDYRNCKTKDDVEEVNSKLNVPDIYRPVGDNNILMKCIQIWLKDSKSEEFEQKYLKIALCVLLNLLKPEIKAEVIGNIPALKNYLFNSNEERVVLPIFPGINYPGIMSYQQSSDRKTLIAERCDFIAETDQDLVIKNTVWKERQVELNQIRYYAAELKQDHKRFISLEEYFNQNDYNLLGLMEKMADIYPLLVQAILDINENYKNQKIILSKSNVILNLDMDTNKVEKINLGFAYLISEKIASNVIATEINKGQYTLKTVNASGSAFWIAGYLLNDACNMNEINLRQKTIGNDKNEDKINMDMLVYSIKRMEGHYLHRGFHNKSEHSFKKSMERTIGNMKGFLKHVDQRMLYLENSKIENAFIKFRLGQKQYQFQDVSLEIAIWSKNYLRYGYQALIKILNSVKTEKSFKLERRVSCWYCYLAEHLYQLSNTNNFLSIKTLASGLFANAILLNLRMQVLERIHCLSKEQREDYLQNDKYPPLGEFELEESAILIIKENVTWENIWINLLNNVNDKNIRFVTHLGWIMMLAKLYESNEYEYSEDKIQERNHFLKELIKYLNISANDKRSENYEKSEESGKQNTKGEDNFPFENLDGFYNIWNPEKVQDIIFNLNELDKKSGIKVISCKDSEYRQYFQRGKIVIDYTKGQLREKSDFLTYSKVQNGLEDVERDIKNRDLFCYTISIKEDKILGVSSINSLFGNSLQVWENNNEQPDGNNISIEKNISKTSDIVNGSQKKEKEMDKQYPKDISDIQEQKENFKEQEGNNISNKQVKNTEFVQLEDTDFNSKEQIEASNPKKNTEKIQDDSIDKIQRQVWEKRIKRFDNYDRIALFQFNIDSSYFHPSMEICNVNDLRIENNYGKSCAEFRRRQILKPVLKACNYFKIDILVLPEYSVRPETVEWIKDEISRLDNKFSVWAGTFRIPPEYKFNDRYWDSKTMNGGIYWNAAILPIIEADKDKNEICIRTAKFKQYPSISLHEDINPCLARQSNNFEPVMKKLHKGKVLKDARDDVTEIICAEMFAVSAVSNSASFLGEFLESYNRYTTSGQWKMDECLKKMEKDILTFGKYTAIYQERSRYDRTPIILLPACTTRATDYYVWGQGNYLAAGIKTVLCNSTYKGATGGSCFIGQDSWDDRKINCNEKLEHNTLYHGLKPGMYRQTSGDKTRGALGNSEQALLIYDVNPSYDKTRPNAESMRDSLSIVAHIPILEERIKSERCTECKCSHLCALNNQKIETKGKNSMEDLVNDYIQKLKNHCIQNEKIGSTMLEKKADDMEKILKSLGEIYNSEWLIKRGEYYKKYHKTRPQSWPPPTLIDWIQIKISYDDFIENSDKYLIQVPKE